MPTDVPPPPASPPTIADLLAELSPRRVPGAQPRRIGDRGDGGYVILVNPDLVGMPLYSYGIGDNDSFDRHFHKVFHGPVRQYDHTVKPPEARDGFTFFLEGISAAPEPGKNTLAHHLQVNGDEGRRFFLKMDVEGAEWDVLERVPDAVLECCDQLVIELHDLTGSGADIAYPSAALELKLAVLRKLNRHFYLWHVHANNYASIRVVDGFKVPDVVEVTWVSRLGYESEGESTRSFPTPLDHPCQSRCYDHMLDFWPFLPGARRVPTARSWEPHEIVARQKPWLRRRWDRLARAVDSLRQPRRSGRRPPMPS